MMIVKILTKKFPDNIAASQKSGAQEHHAGVAMMWEYGNTRPEIVQYCQELGFGTTIVLEPIGNYPDEYIKNIIDVARSKGYVAGMITDPEYPVGGCESINSLTNGYILAEHNDPMWDIFAPKGMWKLKGS